MNQEKIGKFIAEIRKEKCMTQIDLANKLGITDRAISKWENGRGMPDLSLIKPLCNELDITINELLSGEKIKKQVYNKFEENIINTIDYSNEKIKKTKKINIIIYGIITIFIISMIILFLIDVKRMNNKEPVLFSTWGFKYSAPLNFQEEEIEIAIKDYLNIKNDNESLRYNNEKWFCSFMVYLTQEKNDGTLYNVFAWVLEESYYLEGNEIIKDSSSSIPYKFIIRKENDAYVVTDSRIPRDGNLYANDMKNIFPHKVRKDINNVYYDGTIEKLEFDIKEQVKLYFHQ